MQATTAEQFIVLVLCRWKPTAAVTVAAAYQSCIYRILGTVLLSHSAEFALTLCTSK